MSLDRRDLRPDEMASIHRLAVRYPDLADVERDLKDLERLRAAATTSPAAGPTPAPVTPTMSPQTWREIHAPKILALDKHRLRPKTIREATDLLERGLITRAELRDLMSLEPEDEPAPPRHLVARAGWALTWRWGLLATLLVGYTALPRELAPWTLGVVAVVTFLAWPATIVKRSLVGSAVRLLTLAVGALIATYLNAVAGGTVALLAVVAVGTDAAIAVFLPREDS